MRTIEEIKKDQDQAIFDYGLHLIRAKQFEAKIMVLANEASEVHKVLDMMKSAENVKEESKEQ